MENLKQFMLVHHTSIRKDGQLGIKTFRAIPLTGNAPYLTMEYDPETSKLVLCTKTIKQELQAVPKMLPTGEYEKAKNPVPGSPGVLFERRMLDEIYEIHLNSPVSIDEFLKETCINAHTFPYQQFIAQVDINQKPNLITTIS